MDLRRFRYFVALADSLHFGQAAARLGITQPALSQQLQRLEQDLGVTLLARTSRQTVLTKAGTAVLPPLRRCLAAYDEVIEMARSVREEPSRNQLRIGIPCLEADAILEPLLRNVVRRFPDTRIELTESSCECEPAAIHEGRVDAGFVHLPIEGPDLSTMVVRRDELVVLLPRNHPFARDERVDIQKLEDEPFIEFQAHCPAYTQELRRLIRRGGLVSQIEYGSTMLAGIIEMVAQRLGVAIVPGSGVPRETSSVIAKRLSPATKELDLAFVWRSDRVSPAIHRLRNLMDDMVHERDVDQVAVAERPVIRAA